MPALGVLSLMPRWLTLSAGCDISILSRPYPIEAIIFLQKENEWALLNRPVAFALVALQAKL